MTNVQNLILETLKKIQAEQSATRNGVAEIFTRMGQIESGMARIARDESHNYSQIVEDRHSVDELKARVERIERRLEIAD